MYAIDPLADTRWAAFVDTCSRSTVFHSVPWLDSLRRTYGYTPVAYTTSSPASRLTQAVVVCRVASFLTGARLVSLPFSDHCEPLAEDREDTDALVKGIAETLQREKLRYLEVRGHHPIAPLSSVYDSAASYCFHYVDLRPDLSTLHENCHKNSTQKMVSRAQREGLVCESGRSEALLEAFWRLLLMTRRRHGIPPQPKNWFHNLIQCFGESLKLRVAWKGATPVASILTLHHKKTVVYKYGCSDSRYHNLGGMQLLLWDVIKEAKSAGLEVFDLGRTDWQNQGLLQFKDRWGSIRSTLTYSRFSVGASSADGGILISLAKRFARCGKSIGPRLPEWLLRRVGAVLYRHIG